MRSIRFSQGIVALGAVSVFLSCPVWAALGDNAPPIPSTYNTGHPRLPFPDNAFLSSLASNSAALADYSAEADAWDSTNPGSTWQLRRLVIAYMANKIANPTKAATYLAKIKALANLRGTWGKLLYAVNDGVGNGTYTFTSATANFLTGCAGSSCKGNVLSIEARTFIINSVPNANTVVLSQSNPPPRGTNLPVRIMPSYNTADINIALIYDWLYNDLDSATKTEFLTELDVLATEWEENYIGLNASPYNDVFYLRNGISGLIDALVLYPDHPNGLKHLNFMTDVWFNVLLPVWKQVFGPEGGGWHESWTDYVIGGNGNGLTTFIVPSLLCWQSASGDPIFVRESWLKNFAYFTMYMARPDYVMESIGDSSRGYLVADYTALGSLNGLAEIYNDPVIRGWARVVNAGSVTAPDGFEPSAWPYYRPMRSSNPASTRAALPPVRNFTGWGLLSMRTGWSEDDTSVTLKYGDNFWSHEHFDTGSFTIFKRGLLALDSGSYRAGSLSKHENQYTRQTIAHNTLTITDPSDVYPTTFDTWDELGNLIELAPPNDGGQRRIGTLYNQHFPQLSSPPNLGGWMQNWDYYHTGKMIGFASTANYTYSAVDITAAYNNKYSATIPNATNRTYRVQKAVRHMLFVPRGMSAYIIIFDEVISTNASFVKRWILHSVNQPTINANTFQIVRNDLVTSLPYADLWPGRFKTLLTHTAGSGSNLQYQFDGKLYGWMVEPQSRSVNLVGGPGKEFWVEDPLNPGTGTNWNQCMQGQCAANTEGLGPVTDKIIPDPKTAPHEPGSWRIEIKPGVAATQDFFFNVMLATTVEDGSVPTSVSVPASLPAGMAGATWVDGSKTYTVTFPRDGVGGHITIAGVVDEDLLSHAQQLPDQLTVVSGTPQSAPANTSLQSPLLVAVTDSSGNAVPNATVHFALTQGNGLLSSATATTDGQGHASVGLRMGSGAAGSVVKVMADVNGLPPVEFDATVSGAAGGLALSSVSCAPTALNAAASATCTVVLTQPAGSGGASVSLSSNALALTVPAAVTVPAGSTSANFTASLGSIFTSLTGIVTATFGGASQTTSLTLLPVLGPSAVNLISCAPASVTSGGASTCTVVLSQAAGAGGTGVTLSDNSALLTVPGTVVVPSGSTSATFTATVGTISTAQTAVITAALNGASQTATISLVAASASGGTPIPTGTWVMVPTSGFPPSIVGYDNMVYAPGIKKAVMFDNYHNLTSETNEAYNVYDFASNRWDVWNLNGNFHTETMPESGHEVGMFQYDFNISAFINYCCFSGSQGYERAMRTWLFDPIGLVGRDKQTPTRPGNTDEANAAFDIAHNVLVLFDRGTGTWVYDATRNNWVNKTPNGTPPTTSGYFSAMTYNTTDHKIYLFGGVTQASLGTFTNDLYTYDVPSNTWTKLSPSGTLPSPRQFSGWAYDSTHNIFLMFGGRDRIGYLNDTWIYDPAANKWSQLSPAQSPAKTPNSTSFQRLVYDSDDNVFIMTWPGPGGYSNGTGSGYSLTQTWFFRYSGTGPNVGTVTANFTPTAGSLNRNTDGWANEPVLVSDGSNVYAGWIETGRPFDSANAGFPHPYVSQLSGGVWTNLGGSYLAIDSEFAGYDEAHAPSMSMVGGKPWISWYKTSNNGQLTPNSLYAKYWNGQAWVGGAVGAVKAVGANISGRSQLAAVGNTPYIGFEEIDRSCYPWCQNLFVKKWNGSVWSQVGSGPLNRSPYSAVSSPHADSVSLTSDGANPYVAWTEYSMSSSLQADSPPQVYVDKWNGSAWVSLGGSLNVNPSGYANDASIVYSNGQPYVAWTERTQSGNNQVYVKTWNGSSWSLVGSGSLNNDTNTGWAFRPSLVADPATGSLYLGWVEQQNLGQTAQTYVRKYSNGSWTILGGSLNADTLLGSAERVSVAVVGGQPFAVWGEVKYGSLRQIYAKQWNGASWTAQPRTSTTSASCDLNSDGTVNVIDVQLAVNQAIGIAPCTSADLDQKGTCNVIDVQRVINAASGKPCVSGL